MGKLILVGNRLIFDDFSQFKPVFVPVSIEPMPLCRVLFLPMLGNRCGDFHKPGAVFCQFNHIRRGKIFRGILRRIAERLEQPRCDQRGNIVRLAVQHPARLFRRQAGGQLSQERQEPLLFFFHAKSVAGRPKKRTGPLTTGGLSQILA